MELERIDKSNENVLDIPSFIQVSGEHFVQDGRIVRFRGFGIGNWMNTEHFMTGLPGTDHMKRKAWEEVYGKEQADEFWDRYLSDYMGEDDFAFLRELGVNVVRLPFTYRHFEDDQKPGDYRKEGFKHLDRMLELCSRYGIYAILDLHAAPGGQGPDSHADTDLGASRFWHDASYRQRVIGLWRFIASHYKDNPWVAGYDVLNEPVFVTDGAVFNDFVEKVTEAIRQVDSRHIIFIEGDSWAQDFSMLEPPSDEQTAYSFHFYPVYSVRGKEAWTRDDVERDLVPLIARIRDRFHRPLWCGETGSAYDRERISDQSSLVRTTLDILEEQGVSWTLWAYKDAQAMSLVYPVDESPWMKLVREVGFTHRQEEPMAAKVFDMLEKEGYVKPVSAADRFRLQFRLRGVFHDLFVLQSLKPALERIPFRELLEYPASFRLKQCGYHPEIAELVKAYTQTLR